MASCASPWPSARNQTLPNQQQHWHSPHNLYPGGCRGRERHWHAAHIRPLRERCRKSPLRDAPRSSRRHNFQRQYKPWDRSWCLHPPQPAHQSQPLDGSLPAAGGVEPVDPELPQMPGEGPRTLQREYCDDLQNRSGPVGQGAEEHPHSFAQSLNEERCLSPES